jgi:hypothetical protein
VELEVLGSAVRVELDSYESLLAVEMKQEVLEWVAKVELDSSGSPMGAEPRLEVLESVVKVELDSYESLLAVEMKQKAFEWVPKLELDPSESPAVAEPNQEMLKSAVNLEQDSSESRVAAEPHSAMVHPKWGIQTEVRHGQPDVVDWPCRPSAAEILIHPQCPASLELVWLCLLAVAALLGS